MTDYCVDWTATDVSLVLDVPCVAAADDFCTSDWDFVGFGDES